MAEGLRQSKKLVVSVVPNKINIELYYTYNARLLSRKGANLKRRPSRVCRYAEDNL